MLTCMHVYKDPCNICRSEENGYKKLKTTDSIESTTLGGLPRDMWMQIFNFADYQACQQLSLCHSNLHRIYQLCNGNARIYVESRLKNIQQIAQACLPLYINRKLTNPILTSIKTQLALLDYQKLQKSIEDSFSQNIKQPSNEMIENEILSEINQSINQSVHESVKEFLLLIQSIDNVNLENTEIRKFFFNLTELQILYLIKLIEQQDKDLIDYQFYSILKLLYASHTNNTKKFQDAFDELKEYNDYVDENNTVTLLFFVIIAWQKAHTQIVEFIITSFIENEQAIQRGVIDINCSDNYLSNVIFTYDENLITNQLVILDYIINFETIKLIFKVNCKEFLLFFKDFPYEIKEHIFHKYFQKLDFLTRNIFIEICTSKSVDQDFLKFYFKDLNIAHEKEDTVAFSIACQNGSLKAIDLLLSYSEFSSNFDFNKGFEEACLNGELEVVKFLLTLPNVDPAAQNNQAFINACISGNLELVKFLLTLPNVDSAAQNNQAFINACACKNFNIVKFLSTLSC